MYGSGETLFMTALTSRGRYVCFCSCPTWRQGRWGYLSCRLYFCLKYWATVHSIAWPFSSCKGNLVERAEELHKLVYKNHFHSIYTEKGSLEWERPCTFGKGFKLNTNVWWLAGRRVTLHTRYFLFIWPQCVTSTFSPAPTTTTKTI